MNAPLGITFLKKAELYNLALSLDKEYKQSKQPDNTSKSLWPVEKVILRWTHQGHRHLGSAIKTDHLTLEHKDSKLSDFGMFDSQKQLKPEFKVMQKTALHKPLENLVVRGFAEYFDKSHAHTAIIINKEGLLFGNVLTELEKDDWLINFNYKVYGKIMDHLGAFILFWVTVITLLTLLFSFVEKVVSLSAGCF
ncbi:hypothetical protein ISS85_00500 [Candidatus Microgenomates bacterium]|nr:hypothetical protein [Candidatus Microgenomates bacterium]